MTHLSTPLSSTSSIEDFPETITPAELEKAEHLRSALRFNIETSQRSLSTLESLATPPSTQNVTPDNESDSSCFITFINAIFSCIGSFLKSLSNSVISCFEEETPISTQTFNASTTNTVPETVAHLTPSDSYREKAAIVFYFQLPAQAKTDLLNHRNESFDDLNAAIERSPQIMLEVMRRYYEGWLLDHPASF